MECPQITWGVLNLNRPSPSLVNLLKFSIGSHSTEQFYSSPLYGIINLTSNVGSVLKKQRMLAHWTD